MVLVNDKTIEDLVQSNILINFAFEPKGTKKTIGDIAKARDINDSNMLRLVQIEVDRMVADKFVFRDEDGIYIFAKDNKRQYYLEKAGILDILKTY